jgi:Mg2+ and Co2+ transporter CorA
VTALLAFGVGVIWGSHKYAWVMSKKAKRDEEKAEKVKKQREQFKQIQAENSKLRSENDELKKLLNPSQLGELIIFNLQPPIIIAIVHHLSTMVTHAQNNL